MITSSSEGIKLKKYPINQTEIRDEYFAEIVTKIDDYMQSIPIAIQIFSSADKIEKYYEIQKIMSKCYKKYYKKLENIHKYDIRFEEPVNGFYAINIFERK